MINSLNFQGIFPPITTPFRNEQPDYSALTQNVEKWSHTGIKGLVVLGSNGEYVSLNEQEKRRVTETVVDAAPSEMVIIAGTGCESTIETVHLTDDLAALGVHAALIVTPHYYNSSLNESAYINHYTHIADRSPIPILLYSVPKFTHVYIPIRVVKELSQHENIIGMKDSSGDLNLVQEYLVHKKQNFNLMVGSAKILLEALKLGCTGAILALANVAARQCVEIFKLVQKDDIYPARIIQERMQPVNKAVTATYGISGMKKALDLLGFYGGNPRLPLTPINSHEENELKQILETAELLD